MEVQANDCIRKGMVEKITQFTMELYIFALFQYLNAAVMSHTKLPRSYADVILSYTRLQFYTTMLLLPITYLQSLKERFSISAGSLGLTITHKSHSMRRALLYER